MADQPAPLTATQVKHPVRILIGAAVVFCLLMPILLAFSSPAYIVKHVSDDAYYYFNVARNIALGNGLSADGVTTTTGFHPLYCFLLAGLHWLTSPSTDGFVQQAILLNGLCFAATGFVLWWAAKMWWGPVAGITAGLLWWTNPHGVLIEAAGLEGMVYALMLATSFAVLMWILHDQPTRFGIGSMAVLGVALGLTLLSRTDSIVLLPLVGLVVLTSQRGGSWTVRIAGVAVMGGVAIGMLSIWWWIAARETGGSLQGSAVIKQMWRNGMRADAGLWGDLWFTVQTWAKYVAKCFVKVPALKWTLSGVPALYVAVRVGRGRAGWSLLHVLWILPVGLGVAYAYFIDKPRTWYYVPALVGLTILAAGAFSAIWTGLATNRLADLARRTMPLLILLVVLESGAIFARNLTRPRSREQSAAVAAARGLERELPKGTRLGCWHSGIVQYYTPSLTIINLDGLANNEIAAVLRDDKTMNEYWDEREIAYILGQPRQKMGGYADTWGNKKLEFYANGVQKIVSIDE